MFLFPATVNREAISLAEQRPTLHSFGHMPGSEWMGNIVDLLLVSWGIFHGDFHYGYISL